MGAKTKAWAKNVLPTIGMIAAAAAVLVGVVVVCAHIAISDQLRAQLIAGTGLALVMALMFVTGPKRFTAVDDVPNAPATEKPLYVRGTRLTKAEYAGLTTAGQKSAVEAQRGMLFRALYVGLDGRWSTSKVQALAWTLIFAYTLTTIFIADQIGLVFTNGDTFGTLNFPENYLLLLGGPFAALVGAKGITASNSDQKSTDDSDPTQKTAGQGLQEVISDDSGNTDLGDFQFFLFNLVAVLVFLVSFVPAVQNGLAKLPDFLVALTSASALTYLGKKAFETQTPSITAVYPGRVRPGGTLTIRGTGLTAGKRSPIVTIDGVPANDVTITRLPRNASDEVELSAVVPPGLTAGSGKSVSVQPTGGVVAATATVEIIDVAITSEPDPIVWTPLAAVTLNGADIGVSGPNAVSAKIGDVDLVVAEVAPTKIRATLPPDLNIAVEPAARLPLDVTLADGSHRRGSVAVAVPQPVISTVAPSPVVVTAAAAITISGTGFGPNPGQPGAVELGGVRLAWTAWTDTSIVATLPAANSPDLAALMALKGTSVPVTVERPGRPSGSLAVPLSA